MTHATHTTFPPSDINTALIALRSAGVDALYVTDTESITVYMKYPDPDTGHVYTEETPVFSLKDVYDLLGE